MSFRISANGNWPGDVHYKANSEYIEFWTRKDDGTGRGIIVDIKIADIDSGGNLRIVGEVTVLQDNPLA